jgi:hypothetical protein
MSDDNHAAGYDFVRLGEGLADALVRAAEDHLSKAQAILDQSKSLAEIMLTQMRAQAQQIEEMNGRFKHFGEQMLDAHRVLNGVEPTMGKIDAAPSPLWRNPEPPAHDDMKARLRVLPPRQQP